MPERKLTPTHFFVGLILLAVTIWIIFALTNGWWAWALLAVAMFEGWTIANGRPGDTISEIIWELTERPILPFVAGIGVGAFFLPEWYLPGAIMFLGGHFFWQRKGR